MILTVRWFQFALSFDGRVWGMTPNPSAAKRALHLVFEQTVCVFCSTGFSRAFDASGVSLTA